MEPQSMTHAILKLSTLSHGYRAEASLSISSIIAFVVMDTYFP